MSQAPRKVPSQPGVKQANQGHAKKARPNRSNSQSKPPVVKATDGYAMGSYDNEISSEPTSTPSWMRDTPSDTAIAKFPSSPSFPASPSPALTSSSNNLLAPVPFHLPSYVAPAPTAPMPSFAPNFNSAPLALPPVLPPPGLAPLAHPMNGTAPSTLPSAFPTNFMVPPASAPPSSQPLHTQDAIARILALQQANASMSTSSSPITFTDSSNQNSVNFSRNFAEVEQSRASPTFVTSAAPTTPMTTSMTTSMTAMAPTRAPPTTTMSGVHVVPPHMLLPFSSLKHSGPIHNNIKSVVNNGPPQGGHAADFLFDPPASRMPPVSAGKHAPSPRSANLYAHHNFGVPAQP